MKLHHLVLLAGATTLAACTADSPTQAVSTDATAASSVTASASGGGRAQLPPGFSALDFALSANGSADGSGTGQFRFRHESASGTTDFDGSVTCVSFDAANNRAWIGGVVTQNNSTNPALQGAIHQPGRDTWFRVVDNGEDNAAAADRTTVLGFEGGGGIITSAQYCAAQLWTANDANTWAVDRGNIQVRP